MTTPSNASSPADVYGWKKKKDKREVCAFQRAPTQDGSGLFCLLLSVFSLCSALLAFKDDYTLLQLKLYLGAGL